MKMLGQTSPHFIRCIKPNGERKRRHIDETLVLHQLSCLGIIDALDVQKQGYPVRLKYADFAKTYRFSAFGSTTVSNIYSNAKAESQAIIDKLSEANDTLLECKFGRTMIFYKPSQNMCLKSCENTGPYIHIWGFRRAYQTFDVCHSVSAQSHAMDCPNPVGTLFFRTSPIIHVYT